VVFRSRPLAAKVIWAAIAICLALAIVVVVLTNVPATPDVVSQLPNGIYVGGAQGTPHYFVALTSNTDGTLTGAVSYLAQDGQASTDFTFTATTQSGVATLKSSGGHVPNGTVITATYSPLELDLGECTTYLPLAASNADCAFKYSPGGLSYPQHPGWS
jgi:hypothetical protein